MMQLEKKSTLIYLFITAILALQIAYLAVVVINPLFKSEYLAALYYVTYIYSIAMHLMLSILVLIEINTLEEFHVDKFTIITFLLFSILRPRFGFFGENFFIALIGLASIAILVALLVKKPKLPKANLRLSLTGILAGVTLVILLFYIESAFRRPWSPTPLLKNSITLSFINLIVQEFSSGTLLEELLFRGFFWGYLRRQGLEEKKVYWIQFTLFWLVHIRRIVTAPFTFFVAIPPLILISSHLTMRSKQIFPAILSHAIINILSTMLNLATY